MNNYSDLKGIWHAAMVLNDTVYENMTQEKWDSTVDIKVTGLNNLDQLTRNKNIQTFMAFSSVSSLHGNAGQTNYAWANNITEEICRERHNLNLPAVCVQWGPILNAGFLGGVDQKYFSNIKSNYEFLKIDECLYTLHQILSLNEPVVGCYNPNKKEIEENDNKKTIKEQLLSLLGISVEDVSETDTLSNLGLDSLQATEIKNILENKGIQKTSEEILNLTIKDISEF